MTKNKRQNLLKFVLALLCGVVAGFGCLFLPSPETKAATTPVTELSIDSNHIDKSALNALYRRITNNSSATLATLTSKLNGVYYYAGSPIPNFIDASTISANNGNTPLNVIFGGNLWSVIYVTRTGKGTTGGDVIATLMYNGTPLPVNEYVNYSGYAYTASDWASIETDLHPGLLYGNSLVRSKGLNIGSSFSSSGNVKQGGSQSAGSRWAKYTMASVNGSLLKYIQVPRGVEYQRIQSWKEAYKYEYKGLNEAYGDPVSGTWWNGVDFSKKSDYGLWQDDPIWIPSISEFGGNQFRTIKEDGSQSVDPTGLSGWWNLTSDQRKGHYSWLRTVWEGSINFLTTFDVNGDGLWLTSYLKDPLPVRPCMHINLTKMEADAVEHTASPSAVQSTYTGNPQGQGMNTLPSTPSWFDTNKMTVVCNGGAKMINAGTYTCTATLKTGYIWDDNTSLPKNFDFVIAPKSLTLNFSGSGQEVPTVTPGSELVQGDDPLLEYLYEGLDSGYTGSSPPTSPGRYRLTVTTKTGSNYTISGTNTATFTLNVQKVPVPTVQNASTVYTGNPRVFQLENFRKEDVEIVVPSGQGIVFDEDSGRLTVTDAKTYTVKAHLRDSEKRWEGFDDEWQDRDVTFTVTPASLTVTLEAPDGGSSFEIEAGDTPEITIYGEPLGTDEVTLRVYAQSAGGGNKTTLFTGAKLSADTGEVRCALNTVGLSVGETYEIFVELANAEGVNANYDLGAVDPITVLVKAASREINMVWEMTHRGKTVRKISGTEQADTYGETLTYDGAEFVWRASRMITTRNYAVDTSYNADGFTNGYKNERGTNADTYTTSVRIISTAVGVSYAETFEMTWTVDKAKFDFSKVTWKGNGTLSYTGRNQIMELLNLPEGLVANYEGNTGLEVVSDKHASVLSFTLADPDNFVEPVESDPDSYLGTLAWSIDWNIEPAQISVQWGKEKKVGTNGKFFNASVLRDEEFRPAVTHTYYRTDEHGNVLDPTPVDIEAITVPESGSDYYICEISIAGGNGGYILNGSTRSPVFEVKNFGKVAEFKPNALSFPFIGAPIGVQFTNDAGIKKSEYEVKYFDSEGNPLASAPSAVGKYRVGIELLGDARDTFYLVGNDSWDYEIVSRVIVPDWKEEEKPPRLNINKTELGLIEYEIEDADGNRVTADALQEGTYRIRARIKAAHADSVTFTGGASETEWIGFELTQEDLANLKDPNDPSLYPDDPNDPNKPIEDPDDPNNPDDPGPEDPKDEQNYPVWQLGVGLFSLILGIPFFAKGNGYRARAKELRRKAETVRKRAIDPNLGAAGFVLGMDETFLSLTGSVWTGIACGLAALCLLSLVWMITGKRKFARASADLEAAEQEAYVAEKRKQVNERMREEQREEERRKREEEREEEYRRRDEERRRQQEEREEELRRREEQREEARRKRDEEREEEQQRRNEEMKMMFAGMMMNNKGGNGNAQTTFDATASTEEIVARVVAQLLPSLQSALQPAVLHALPSADEDKLEEIRREQRELREMMQSIVQGNATVQTVVQQSEPQAYEQVVEEVVEEVIEEPPQVEEVIEEVHVIEDQPQYEEIVEEVVEEQPQYEEVQVVEEAAAVEEPEEKPKKEKIPAEPKLTLDDAYARLSKEQKKFFDGLRAYAMSKDKCKEKKSTYFILCGQSTANPLIKLCIKKDTTVARFKLEDEYTKSLRRNAGSEGTKIKVKETEVSISDAQAFETAKEMIDLREDQIERYNEFLKEQRQLSKLK